MDDEQVVDRRQLPNEVKFFIQLRKVKNVSLSSLTVSDISVSVNGSTRLPVPMLHPVTIVELGTPSLHSSMSDLPVTIPEQKSGPESVGSTRHNDWPPFGGIASS